MAVMKWYKIREAAITGLCNWSKYLITLGEVLDDHSILITHLRTLFHAKSDR